MVIRVEIYIIMEEAKEVEMFCIRVSYNSDNEITLIDPIDTSEEFHKQVWTPYMRELYSDLLLRTNEPLEKGINKFALHSYMALPGIIGDSFFRVLDTNNDGYIDIAEFLQGIAKLYFGDLNKLNFIFQMYDFDGNGIISKEDIRTMLSYVPLSVMTHGHKEGNFTHNGGGLYMYNQ